jgi:DHA1 family tetracycline resistance protein-like MFS transporter
MSDTATPPPSVSRHATLFVLLTVLLDMVGFGIIIPVLPVLIEDVGHMSLAEATVIGGWMAFAFSITQFLFSPLMGNLSDRFGRRPLLLLAVGGLGVDYLLHAWAPTLFWLFVGRAIAGFCGSSWVIANAYIADVTAPEERAKAFGIMGAAFGVGFVIGPAIGGLLGEFGPRVPFIVAAAISLLNLIYGWFVLPESLPVDRRRAFQLSRSNPFGAFRVFRTYKGVLPLCAVMFVFFFASSIYPAIWPFWVMAAFQGLGTGPAVKYLGEARVVLLGLCCAMVAMLGYGFVGSLGAVVVLMVVHGPEGFVHPMLTAMMSKAVPENAQGELQGGISAITNIAMLAGTVFFAQIFGHFMAEGRSWQSPDVAFWAGAAIMGLAVVLYLVVRPRAGEPV